MAGLMNNNTCGRRWGRTHSCLSRAWKLTPSRTPMFVTADLGSFLAVLIADLLVLGLGAAPVVEFQLFI